MPVIAYHIIESSLGQALKNSVCAIRTCGRGAKDGRGGSVFAIRAARARTRRLDRAAAIRPRRSKPQW
jgi:hypothetical protein